MNNTKDNRNEPEVCDFQGDKYKITGNNVDCNTRIHKCKAACCRLPFPLTQQDISESIVFWDPDLEYYIQQNENNYCCHISKNYTCRVYKWRPFKCRIYNCQSDSRIWLDFEQMIINPKINNPKWPETLIVE